MSPSLAKRCRAVCRQYAGYGALYAAFMAAPALAQPVPTAAPPPSDKEITIKLPINAWNVVLQALVKQPYDSVQSIIAAMNTQAAAQLAPPTPPDKKSEKK